MLRIAWFSLLTAVLFGGFVPSPVHPRDHSLDSHTACRPARPAAAGEASYTLKSGEQTRRYLLYIPESYDGTTAMPLVFSFHGFASWPAQQRDMSSWNRLADEHGLIAVYPQGTGLPLRWTIGGPFVAEDAPDDPAFIAQLLDTLMAELCLDAARVYATGLSNGGGMSHLLACTLADRIAAIGTVAGAYIDPDNGCQPARPVPVITFHGDLDPIVPYNGGDSGPFAFPAVRDWAQAWGERNACALITQTDAVPPDVLSTVSYEDCAGDASVIFITIHGGGHTWPGSPLILPEAIVGLTSDAVDASEAMWAFFTQHPLR